MKLSALAVVTEAIEIKIADKTIELSIDKSPTHFMCIYVLWFWFEGPAASKATGPGFDLESFVHARHRELIRGHERTGAVHVCRQGLVGRTLKRPIQVFVTE